MPAVGIMSPMAHTIFARNFRRIAKRQWNEGMCKRCLAIRTQNRLIELHDKAFRFKRHPSTISESFIFALHDQFASRKSATTRWPPVSSNET